MANSYPKAPGINLAGACHAIRIFRDLVCPANAAIALESPPAGNINYMDGVKTPVLEITSYTDPYCTWCWGSEPVLRHIQEVYGDQVSIHFRMGGLVKDTRHFQDPLNQIGGPEMYRQVADHWREASQRHGMPVNAEIFMDMKDEFRSTWPANIAYKAAELQDRALAEKYLRRLREAAAAERQPIHRLDVQARLAEEVGLDRARLLEDIDRGVAEEAFLEDLLECQEKGVTGFPTFLIRNRAGEETVLHGFQGFHEFEHAFSMLAGDKLLPRPIGRSDQRLVEFVGKYGKVAPREAAEVFSESMAEANQ